jgi:hypothetical protein
MKDMVAVVAVENGNYPPTPLQNSVVETLVQMPPIRRLSKSREKEGMQSGRDVMLSKGDRIFETYEELPL